MFCLLNIRMINLSFDEVRLIAQQRNISDYENKSTEDLMKVLIETKSETPKPETPKIPKPETPKTPKPKPEIRVNQKKLKKVRQNFDKLRQVF